VVSKLETGWVVGDMWQQIAVPFVKRTSVPIEWVT